MTNPHPERLWLVGAGALVALGAIASVTLFTRPEPQASTTNDDKPFVAYNIDNQSASKSAPQQAKSTAPAPHQEPSLATTPTRIDKAPRHEQTRSTSPNSSGGSKQARPHIIQIKGDHSASIPPPAENIEQHAPEHDPIGPTQWMATPSPKEQALIDARLSRGRELVSSELARQQNTNQTHHAARDFVDRVTRSCADMEEHIDPRGRLMIHARLISEQDRGRLVHPTVDVAVYAKSPTLHQCIRTNLTRGSFDARGDVEMEADFTVFLSSPR